MAVSFVPFGDGISIDCRRLKATVAFVALSAVVMFPGGINTPLTRLMSTLFHCVVLMTVTF